MDLLEYNEDTGRVTPSPEARQIEAFRQIIVKDKGSDGDHDGRKKSKAIKMLTYVRLIEHPMSAFMEYDPRKRHDKLVEFLDLDLKELNPIIIEARRVYADIVSSSTVKTINSIKKGLFSTVDLMDIMSVKVNKFLEQDEITLDDIEKANKLIDNMLDKSAKVPKTIEILEVLAEKVKKEQATRARVKGKGEINFFE
jgi:hypothetical protein